MRTKFSKGDIADQFRDIHLPGMASGSGHQGEDLFEDMAVSYIGLVGFGSNEDEMTAEAIPAVPHVTGWQWASQQLADNQRCRNMFRMSPLVFEALHNKLVAAHGLRSTREVCSKEALTLFLWTCGVPQSQRQGMNRFEHSAGTICKRFNDVLHSVSGLAGFGMDPEKRNEMSLEDKRELVYEVSKWPQGASEILQCWTRRDLLQLICAELGKERKYTNVSKSKMIAYLLKLVSRKNGQLKDDNVNASLLGQNNNDTQKKANEEQPQHFTNRVNCDPSTCREAQTGSLLICRNVACQATLDAEGAYCKRCSCCICRKYDENKDPSLWLVCSSDNPYCGYSCGMSCHLKCALKNKKAGIVKNGCNKLDGSFYCVCCGKINWLMRSLRKQLAIAREARRVDVLCERLSLSHKMVKGSEHYRELANIISSAVKILEKEVGGALDQVSAIMGRGIVNRLSCGADVQKLCSCALEVVDSSLDVTLELETNNNTKPVGPQPQILFEEITPFSLVIVLNYQDNIAKENIDGCKVWHRNARVPNYPAEPTCHVLRPNTRSLISGLSPSTEYSFKVLPFGITQGFGEWEAKCSTQSLERGSSQCSTQNSESMCIKEYSTQYGKKELNLQKQQRATQYDSPKGSTNSSENNVSPDRYSKRAKMTRLDGASDNDESQFPPTSEVLPFASSNSSPSEAPSKPDWLSSTPDSACKKYVEQQYEYCVKVIRWLEHEGRMDKDFRVKFLTWFSLKASAQERRIVSAFIDALISDPASLVAQLIDAFMDVVCSKEKPAQSKAVCYKLWH